MPRDEALANQAEALLRAADEAIARQDWTGAGRHLDEGLQLVAERYLSPDAIDSSGRTLVLAGLEEAQGRMASAIGLRRSVLHSRTVQLREKSAAQAPAPPSNSATSR